MNNEEKAREIAGDLFVRKGFGEIECYYGAIKMAQWKDEQFIETAQEDAENYVKGVAKANPDLNEWVLNLIETTYIAGRNRIK